MERGKREAFMKDPKNEELRSEYTQFIREKLEFELKEFELAADAYPTDMRWRFEAGKRLFSLGRFQDAIPVLQQARNDPKFRVDAGNLLGLAFFQAGYLDEADDTLGQTDKGLPTSGRRPVEGNALLAGRVLEQKGLKPEAASLYSKVAQWEFNYQRRAGCASRSC